MTLVGSQRDDDADGYGNACDGDFNNDAIVDELDLVLIENALGAVATDVTCGTNGDESCAQFDVAGTGYVVDEEDLARFSQLLGESPGPRCAACDTPATLGCQGPGC
jgi:hypothetical protein